MKLGEKIRELRVNKGLTQLELAELVGTTKQNIYKYENSLITNIPLDKLEKIANALNISPVYLMGWNEEQNISNELKEKYRSTVEFLSKELMLAPKILYDAGIIELLSKLENMANDRVSKFLSNNNFKTPELALKVYEEISDLSENDIKTILDMINILKDRLNNNNNN